MSLGKMLKIAQASFKKAIGRPDDIIGGDWYFRGALVKVNGKIKS